MKFSLTTKPTDYSWTPVKIGDETIELQSRPATSKEYIDDVISGQHPISRAMTCIVGWKGVEDLEGKPVPFSKSALAVVTEQLGPDGWMQLAIIGKKSFDGDEQPKNSDVPSGTDSGDGTQTATPSSSTANSTDSADSPVSTA